MISIMTTGHSLLVVLGAALVILTSSPAEGVYCFGERDGNVIIPAEQTKLTGAWEMTKTISGFTGTSALMWTGKNQYKYNGEGVLEYEICSAGGAYKVMGRCARPDGKGYRNDEANDFYVKVGDEMMKLFAPMGSNMNVWKMTSKFDHKHQKSEPIITLPKGCSTFTIAGRSNGLTLDTIRLVRDGSPMSDSSKPMMVPCHDGKMDPSASPTPSPQPKPTKEPAAQADPLCSAPESGAIGRPQMLTVHNRRKSTILVATDVNQDVTKVGPGEQQVVPGSMAGTKYIVYSASSGRCYRTFELRNRKAPKNVYIGGHK